MKTKKIAAFITVILLFMIVGGLIWLARAPIAPPSLKIEKTIPDDHIPR